MEHTSRSSTKAAWDDLIAYAERKLARSRLKSAQLEAILVAFREQAQDGQPCPTAEVAVDLALSKALQ